MPLWNIKKGTGKKHSAVAFAGCVQAQAGTASCVRRLVGQGELCRVANLERSEKKYCCEQQNVWPFYIYLFILNKNTKPWSDLHGKGEPETILEAVFQN